MESFLPSSLAVCFAQHQQNSSLEGAKGVNLPCQARTIHAPGTRGGYQAQGFRAASSE